MANMRWLSTRIWREPYVQTMDSLKKELFVYLHLNSEITYYGVLVYNSELIAQETGIPNDSIKQMIQDFEDDGQVIVRDNRICVRGFLKRTRSEDSSVSPQTQAAFRRDRFFLNQDIVEVVEGEIQEAESEMKPSTERRGRRR